MPDYPGAIPSLGPVPGSPITTALGASSPTHADQHQELIDEVVAIATELGTDPSGTGVGSVKDLLAFMARGHIIQTINPAGASQTFDLSAGATKVVTLTAATCTLSTPTNLIAPSGGGFYANWIQVIFKQDGTGSREVAWWSGVRWPGGAAPTLTDTPTTGRDAFVLTSYDGGSTWDADYALALA
jgi:hypothetical protein